MYIVRGLAFNEVAGRSVVITITPVDCNFVAGSENPSQPVAPCRVGQLPSAQNQCQKYVHT